MAVNLALDPNLPAQGGRLPETFNRRRSCPPAWLIAGAVLGSVWIFFLGIGDIPLLSENEGRRMAVILEMVTGGRWLVPTLNGEPYLAKPPLYYWLAAALSRVFASTAEGVLRLPSSLSAFALAWILFGVLRRSLGTAAALAAVGVLLTSHRFTLFARRAEIEMLLTFLCFVSLLLWWLYLKRPKRRLILGAYAFLGLAFLTKGPVSLLFTAWPVLLYGFLSRDPAILKSIRSVAGWMLFAVIALPWYLYIAQNVPGLEAVAEEDLWGKIAGSPDSSLKYPLELIGSLAPWSTLAPALVFMNRESLRSGVGWTADRRLFWFCALAVPVVTLSFFAEKQAKYLLPALPSGAVCLGILIDSALEGHAVSGRKGRWTTAVACVGVAAVVACGLYYSFVEPRIYRYRFHALTAVPESLTTLPRDLPIYSYKELYPRLIYRMGRPIRAVNARDMEIYAESGEGFVIIVEEDYWKEFSAAACRKLKVIDPFFHDDEKAMIYRCSGAQRQPNQG